MLDEHEYQRFNNKTREKSISSKTNEKSTPSILKFLKKLPSTPQLVSERKTAPTSLENKLTPNSKYNHAARISPIKPRSEPKKWGGRGVKMKKLKPIIRSELDFNNLTILEFFKPKVKTEVKNLIGGIKPTEAESES